MMIYILKIFVAAGALALLFYFYVRFLERRATYQPSRTFENSPGDIGLNYKDVYFETSDNIKLNGWLVPAENAKITLIFCQANGGNISYRLEKILFFHKLGVNLFIFDYRGYGLSLGSPSEQGLYRDIEAAYKFLQSGELKNQKIVVYGTSLGGAVAVDLASKHPVDGLILEGTFTSTVDMGKVFYPWIPSFLSFNKFDSFTKISKINIPKLIMHSETDDIIPFSQGQKLFENAPEPKQFLKINGFHNEAFFASESIIEPAIRLFIKNLNN